MIVIGFIAAMTVPFLMILWGASLRKHPPAYLQGKLSFRTKRAKSDEELWNFANTLFSHMILVTGANVALVSAVFYIGSLILTKGSHWMAATVSLLCVQAVCVVILYRMTDFLVKKMYQPAEDEEESAEELEISELRTSEPENPELGTAEPKMLTNSDRDENDVRKK